MYERQPCTCYIHVEYCCLHYNECHCTNLVTCPALQNVSKCYLEGAYDLPLQECGLCDHVGSMVWPYLIRYQFMQGVIGYR